MKTLFLVVALTSALGLALAPAHAANGITGNPVNWVQVGETTDTLLLIDANSITGFEAPNLGMAHRADYMFKGKKNDHLTSKPKTAFMVQGECDDGRGNLTTFFTGADGQPSGKGETQKFKLDGETWVDAVARTLCKARQIMMDNQRVR